MVPMGTALGTSTEYQYNYHKQHRYVAVRKEVGFIKDISIGKKIERNQTQSLDKQKRYWC